MSEDLFLLERIVQLTTYPVVVGDDGLRRLPDGSEWSDQLAWPSYARRILGERAEIMGFWSYENISARIANEIAERRDFALIDKRFILDGWLANIAGHGNGLTDLGDQSLTALIRDHYGDPGRWERSEWLEGEVDAEPADLRQQVMTGLNLPGIAGMAGLGGVQSDEFPGLD